MHAYGVTHRDLKPQNVILGAQGPQLIDFGIARGVGATELTQDGQAPGTPGYTAPEVLLKGETGAAADVFALGATLAYAPRGVRRSAPGWRRRWLPAVHEPVDVLGVEPGLAALIEACVAKDPAARPSPAEVIRLCGVRDALVDDPVYTALGALGEPVPLHEMRTQGPGYPYVPTQAGSAAAGPVRPASRRTAWAVAAVAVTAALALAAWQLLPLDGGGGRDEQARGGGRTPSQSPAAPGQGPAGAPQPSASSGGSGTATPVASTGGARPPAPYIENNQISHYFWKPSADPEMAAHGVGQCNQPAEQKPPGADFQTTAKVSGNSTTIEMRIKYAEMKPTKPDPYYVSVAVRSPHDLDLETGKPFKMDNKSVGFTSKPIDIYGKWPSGEFLSLKYPDDFADHTAGKTYPAVPATNDPGDWTLVFYHVEDDPTKYTSIGCSGFRVG